MGRVRTALFRVKVEDNDLEKHGLKIGKVMLAIKKMEAQVAAWRIAQEKNLVSQRRVVALLQAGKISTEEAALAIRDLRAKYVNLTGSINKAVWAMEAQGKKLKELQTISKKTAQVTDSRYSKFIGTATKIGIVTYATKRILDSLQRAAESVNLRDTLTMQMAGFEDKLNAARKATGGLVGDLQLMKSAALMSSFDIPMSNWPEMLGLVSKMAVRTGQDINYLMNSITTGVARLSPRILDNLGITVNLTDAYSSYAIQLGKTSDHLSEVEKRQAVVNVMMDAMREKTEGVNAAMAAGAGLKRLETRLDNFTTNVMGELLGVLEDAGYKIDRLFSSNVSNLQEDRLRSFTLSMKSAITEYNKLKHLGEDTSGVEYELAILNSEQEVYERFPKLMKEMAIEQDKVNERMVTLRETYRAFPGAVLDPEDLKLYNIELNKVNAKSNRLIAAYQGSAIALNHMHEFVKKINERTDLTKAERIAALTETRKKILAYIGDLMKNAHFMSVEQIENASDLNMLTEKWNKLFDEALEKQKPYVFMQKQLNDYMAQTVEYVKQFNMEQAIAMDRINGVSEAQIRLITGQAKLKKIQQEVEAAQKAAQADPTKRQEYYDLVDKLKLEGDRMIITRLQAQAEKDYAAYRRNNFDEYATFTKAQKRAEYKRLGGKKQERYLLQLIAKAHKDILAAARDENLIMYKSQKGFLRGYEQLAARLKALHTAESHYGRSKRKVRIKIEPVYTVKDDKSTLGPIFDISKAAYGIATNTLQPMMWNALAYLQTLLRENSPELKNMFGGDVLDLMLDPKLSKRAEKRVDIFMTGVAKAFSGMKDKFGSDIWDPDMNPLASLFSDSKFKEAAAEYEKTRDRLLSQTGIDINKAMPELHNLYNTWVDIRDVLHDAGSEMRALGYALGTTADRASKFNLVGDTGIKRFRMLSSAATEFGKALEAEGGAANAVAGGMRLLGTVAEAFIKSRKDIAAVEAIMEGAAAWASWAKHDYAAAAAHIVAAGMYAGIAGGLIKLPSGKNSDNNKSGGNAAAGTGGDIHVHVYGPILQSEAERGALINYALQQARSEGRI